MHTLCVYIYTYLYTRYIHVLYIICIYKYTYNNILLFQKYKYMCIYANFPSCSFHWRPIFLPAPLALLRDLSERWRCTSKTAGETEYEWGCKQREICNQLYLLCVLKMERSFQSGSFRGTDHFHIISEFRQTGQTHPQDTQGPGGHVYT